MMSRRRRRTLRAGREGVSRCEGPGRVGMQQVELVIGLVLFTTTVAQRLGVAERNDRTRLIFKSAAFFGADKQCVASLGNIGRVRPIVWAYPDHGLEARTVREFSPGS